MKKAQSTTARSEENQPRITITIYTYNGQLCGYGLLRSAGARIPVSAVLVVESSRWGNPFTLGEKIQNATIRRYC